MGVCVGECGVCMSGYVDGDLMGRYDVIEGGLCVVMLLLLLTLQNNVTAVLRLCTRLCFDRESHAPVH
jgi:hypothetical protein